MLTQNVYTVGTAATTVVAPTNDIWLGTVDGSYVLQGGEEVSMYLRPYETINATATREGCRLAVMRQD